MKGAYIMLSDITSLVVGVIVVLVIWKVLSTIKSILYRILSLIGIALAIWRLSLFF